MLTRRSQKLAKEQEIRKKRRENTRVIIRPSVYYFLNPYNNFRVNDTVYISEEMLRNPRCRLSPMDPIFSFNRIQGAANSGGFVTYAFGQVTRDSDCSLNYMVERFRSFTDQKFCELAERVAELSRLDALCTFEHKEIISSQNINMSSLASSPCFIIENCLSNNSLSYKAVHFSEALLSLLGLETEEVMLSTVKFNRLPMKFYECVNYIDQMIAYIDTLITFRKLFIAKDFEELARFTQINSYPIKYQLITRQKSVLNCEATLKLTPLQLLVVINKIEELKPKLVENLYRKDQLEQSEIIEEDQYEVLNSIMKVSKNRLRIHKAKVCGYRDMPKSVQITDSSESST